jgi:glutamyl/glutaminyl-tRNA synthetase
LKEVLINFIALLGWNPGEGENREIFSKEELIELFSIERVNSSGAVFNLEKLNWMNAEYIKNYNIDKLADLAEPYLVKAGYDISDKLKTKRVLEAVRTYVNRLDEIPSQSEVYFSTKVDLTGEQNSILKNESSKKVISSVILKVETLHEITPDSFKHLIKEIQIESKIKGKELFQPIRIALTGKEHGPELGIIAYVLGKEELLKRLRAVV